MARGKQLALLSITTVLAVLLSAPAAGADVVTPPGACVGSGAWQRSGQQETSTDHDPSDVIEVPRSDTVRWAGNVKGFALGAEGPRRDISGEVQLDLPIGSVTIDDWGGSSVRYANEGEHEYDLPNVLAGIKMKLHGEHRENGKVVCAGSVFVKIDGTSPLLIVAVGLGVVALLLLFVAGRPVFKKLWAYEDVNPG